MCCFSQPIIDVSKTRIFARMVSAGRQVLAYQMMFASDAPVAMVLPLPTPPNSPEDAVEFISLESYPDMFQELFRLFQPVAAGPGRAMRGMAQTLAVHEVGDFIASFVPRLADFSRLDARFRMPAGTLDRIPALADWGFAVFQLAATKGKAEPHPMAFEFPTRDGSRLFFPTLHVHDGALHATAEFDHHLYAQGLAPGKPFKTSYGPLGAIAHRAPRILDADHHVSRCELVGKLPNQDTWVALEGH